MQAFAQTADAVAATTKKLEKVRLVAEYFRGHPVEEAAQAAVFLSGRAFPAWEERTLQVGGTLLWRTVGEISGKGEVALLLLTGVMAIWEPQRGMFWNIAHQPRALCP